MPLKLLVAVWNAFLRRQFIYFATIRIQSYLPDDLPLKIKVGVKYTTMVPYHILIICKTFPRHDISNALLPVIVRLLVVSAKFLFRAANIVLTSRRAAEQAGNAKEPAQDRYQDGGLL